jgi:hypothetical protein
MNRATQWCSQRRPERGNRLFRFRNFAGAFRSHSRRLIFFRRRRRWRWRRFIQILRRWARGLKIAIGPKQG